MVRRVECGGEWMVSMVVISVGSGEGSKVGGVWWVGWGVDGEWGWMRWGVGWGSEWWVGWGVEWERWWVSGRMWVSQCTEIWRKCSIVLLEMSVLCRLGWVNEHNLCRRVNCISILRHSVQIINVVRSIFSWGFNIHVCMGLVVRNHPLYPTPPALPNHRVSILLS